MQNFTLGKRGLPMLLFALTLLTTSFSSFGQENCPTDDGTDDVQTFCYLETVSAIQSDGTGTSVFQTADTVNDTQPIPGGEILADGVTYYVGTSDANCARVAVQAEVNTTSPPANGIYPGSNSFTIAPCEESSLTVTDLAAYFEELPDYEIVVYTTQFGSEVATGELIANENYFVGQVYTGTDTTPNANCPSFRVAVGYDPTEVPAPTAVSPQTFCEGATVADLVATGTSPNTQDIRWYRSENSFEPLADNTLLIDNQVYYATQIVNDRNDPFPPCESQERTAVLVDLQPVDAGNDNLDAQICQAELQARLDAGESARDIFLSLLDNGVPTDGTFEPSIDQLAAEYSSNPYQTFETTYTVTSPEGCTDSAELALMVSESFNAGADNTGTTFCRSELPETFTEDAIRNFFGSLLSEDADTNGTFNNQTIQEITTAFNNGNGTGIFSTIYTVGAGTACEDTAQLEVTIYDSGSAGEDSNLVFCQVEVETLVADFLANPTQDSEEFLAEWIGDRDTYGTFSGDPLTLILNQYQAGTWPIVVSTIYTIGEGTECENSANISITITEGGTSVEDNAATICNVDVPVIFEQVPEDVIAYYVELAGGVTGGTFNPSIEELIQDYSRNNIGDFTTIYTVGAGTACEDSAELTITVTDNIPANAGPDTTLSFCSAEGAVDLTTMLNAGANPNGSFQGLDNNMFNPSEAGAGTYTFTFMVDASAPCVEGEDTATYTVVVTEGGTSVEDNAATICNVDVPVIFEQVPEDVIAYYVELAGGITGGTFNPSIEELIQDYSRNNIGDFTTIYTVGAGTACEDSAELTITVTDNIPANAGPDTTLSFCSAEGAVDLTTMLNAGANPNGSFQGLDNNMFNPSEAGAGTYTFTFMVDASAPCVESEDTATYTVVVTEGGTTVEDNTVTICNADVPVIFEQVPEDVIAYYVELAGGVTGGTFNPSIEELIQNYAENNIGNFTTIYTVGEGTACEDSAELTITVTDNIPANAGPDTTLSFCSAEGAVDLTTMLNAGANPNGSFQGLDNNMFNPSEAGAGTYTFTFMVDASAPCVEGEDTATYTVVVTEGEANAGEDNTIEVCNSDVRNLNSTTVRNLYLGLLDEGVSTAGTFNPTIAQLINQYNTVSNFGDFTTTYTVGNGDCQDSAVLTVTVVPANDAGDDVNIALCTTGEAVDLFEYLSPLATLNGTFEGFEDGVFDPAVAEPGDTVITYEVPEDDSVCSTGNFTATFTITVSEPVAANAGDDVTIEYCSELNEDIALSSLLSEGAIVGGTFSAPFANGTFNPSLSGEGEYVVTYTLDGEACTTGTDSSTITITVVGATEAPVADAEQTFCFVDEPTVGDIVVTGDGVVIYEDAELTTPAEDTDPLVNGVSYFASFSESAACASGVTMITVTIQDSDAPTLVMDGDEFCRSDNPTVQELINNLNGTGIQIYSAVTGGTALATTTLLEDGVTYFASGTDAEGACESSERLAVQVEVDFCGIPEGFSPNGDDINDEFVIPDIATDYPNYDLEVYNRWGSLVFEGNASTGDWDGTSNQSATLGDGVLPTGFYFYILNYNDGSTEPVQGKVYLSR